MALQVLVPPRSQASLGHFKILRVFMTSEVLNSLLFIKDSVNKV